MERKNVVAPMTRCLVLLALGVPMVGCTPSARQDVGAAGASLDSAATKSVAATDKVLDNADKKVAKSADVAGKVIKADTTVAVKGTEKALDKAGADVKAGSETVTMTPKVKSAILADDTVKIADLDVDTHSDTKTIVVQGTAPTAAEKKSAIADAQKAIAGDSSGYAIVDKIVVSPAKK